MRFLTSNLELILEETDDHKGQRQRRVEEDDRDRHGDEGGGREGGRRGSRQDSARPRTAKRPPSALQRGDRERRGGEKAFELERRRGDFEVNTEVVTLCYRY